MNRNGTRLTIGAAAAALLLSTGLPATAQQPQPRMPRTTTDTLPSLNSGDRQFLVEATRGSEREVELGELAKEKGQSIAVKEFGARMVTDHGNAARELKQLALSKGIRLGDTKKSAEEPSFDRLTKLSRPEFDKVYVDTMVEDHEKDVAEFRRMSEQAQDPDVKAWATKTLPTIEGHLQTLKAMQGTMQGSLR